MRHSPYRYPVVVIGAVLVLLAIYHVFRERNTAAVIVALVTGGALIATAFIEDPRRPAPYASADDWRATVVVLAIVLSVGVAAFGAAFTSVPPIVLAVVPVAVTFAAAAWRQAKAEGVAFLVVAKRGIRYRR